MQSEPQQLRSGTFYAFDHNLNSLQQEIYCKRYLTSSPDSSTTMWYSTNHQALAVQGSLSANLSHGEHSCAHKIFVVKQLSRTLLGLLAIIYSYILDNLYPMMIPKPFYRARHNAD